MMRSRAAIRSGARGFRGVALLLAMVAAFAAPRLAAQTLSPYAGSSAQPPAPKPPPAKAPPPNAVTHPDPNAIPTAAAGTTPADASVPVSDGTSQTALAKMQPAPEVAGPLLDHLVAVVNDDLVLESDVEEEMRFAAFQAGGADTRSQAIERLIDRMLIEEQEKLQPPAPVTDAELAADIADLRKSLPACAHGACATDAEWKAFLANHGFTKAEFDARWRERMGILRFIEQRFRLGLRVSQAQIKDYYETTMLPEYAKHKEKPPALATLSSRIQEVLLQQQVTKLLDTWLKTLRAQGTVRLINESEVGM